MASHWHPRTAAARFTPLALCFLCFQMKLITPSALVERLKINASLARAAIKELEAADTVKRVSYHHAQWIYTRATKDE